MNNDIKSLTIQEAAKIFVDESPEFLAKGYLAGANSHKIELSNRAQGGSYLSSILYLLQSDLSGFNVCPYATESCKEICLGTCSGHAAMIKKGEKTNNVQLARLRRTLLLKNHKGLFMSKLENELNNLVKRAKGKGVTPAFRFNGTSDLAVENMGLMEKYPQVQFYDYTKSFTRMSKFLAGDMPTNYHLTYSYTPENAKYATLVLRMGGNVAVIFDSKNPEDFVGKKSQNGSPIISGDDHDLRFEDPQGGYIIGLTRKGHHKSTKGMFVNPNRLLKA